MQETVDNSMTTMQNFLLVFFMSDLLSGFDIYTKNFKPKRQKLIEVYSSDPDNHGNVK